MQSNRNRVIHWADASGPWGMEVGTLFQASLNGIEAEVQKGVDDEFDVKTGDLLAVQPNTGWFWTVQPTGQRAECPEVYSAGRTLTQAGACVAAEQAMLKADDAYPTMGKDGW